MSAPAANDATPLPEAKVTLRSLHALCDQCLEFADRTRHRNELMLNHYLDLGDKKIDMPTFRRNSKQLGEFQNYDKNNYVPNAAALEQYFPPEPAALLQEAFNQGGPSTLSAPADQAEAERWVASAVSLLMGQRLHVQLLRDLKKRIEVKLEPGNRKGADSRADIQRIFAQIEPQNENVRLLYRQLERQADSSKSQNAIAVEFTDGDRTRAASLLRQVRRYREKLAAALRELES